MRYLLPLLLVLSGLFAAPPALASDAEQVRLEEELQRLAQKNAWAGVERTYAALLALGVPLTPNDHLLGSQASGSRGETFQSLERLEAAVAAGDEATSASDPAWSAAKSQLEALNQLYGKVDIVVVPPRLSALVPYVQPFAVREKDAIVAARKILIQTNSYKGLLPVGKYHVDGVQFEILPGQAMAEIRVTP